jgi:hypothetical protein
VAQEPNTQSCQLYTRDGDAFSNHAFEHDGSVGARARRALHEGDITPVSVWLKREPVTT